MEISDSVLLKHLRNFIAVVTSDNLWYNFDLERIVTDEVLRNQTSMAQPPIRLVSNIPNILPIYGNIDKALQFWIPKLEDFIQRRLSENAALFGENGKSLNQADPNSIFNTLEEDKVLDIIDGMSGINLIAACAVSPRFEDICKKYQERLFKQRLQKEYPFYESVQSGNEMEAYETLLKGTKIVADPPVFDFTGFSSVKDFTVTSYGGSLFKMIIGGFIQTGGFFAMFAYDANEQFHERLEILLQRTYNSLDSTIPQNIQLPLPVIHASVSGSHVLVLLEDGNVYGWGYNIKEDVINVPTLIVGSFDRPYNLDYQLIGVCSGDTFSIYYSRTEIIFTGQMGNYTEFDKLINVEKDPGIKIVEVIASELDANKAYIYDVNGNVFSFDGNVISPDEDPREKKNANLNVTMDEKGTVRRDGREIETNVEKIYTAGEVVFMLK